MVNPSLVGIFRGKGQRSDGRTEKTRARLRVHFTLVFYGRTVLRQPSAKGLAGDGYRRLTECT
ncbi:hypothetical protein, partial [Enterobacter sp.]|uniref:hypothetical protein n=1 Tax=Enterobacter sp. TaxID=42895 RepID=UPI00296FF7A6